MGHLSNGDVARLLSVVRNLYWKPPGKRPDTHLLEVLLDVVPDALTGYSCLGPGGRTVDIGIHPIERLSRRDQETIGALAHQHPFFPGRGVLHRLVPPSVLKHAPPPRLEPRYRKRLNTGNVVTLSEALAPRERRKVALFGEVLDRVGANQSLGVQVRRGLRSPVHIVFSRARDFGDREREMVTAIRPHIAEFLALHDPALTGDPGTDPRLLQLRPAPRRHLAGLTPREEEVLLWLGQGKSNSEIAEILCMASATVKKHCERIFEKIGVENRTAAALWFRRAGA